MKRRKLLPALFSVSMILNATPATVMFAQEKKTETFSAQDPAADSKDELDFAELNLDDFGKWRSEKGAVYTVTANIVDENNQTTIGSNFREEKETITFDLNQNGQKIETETSKESLPSLKLYFKKVTVKVDDSESKVDKQAVEKANQDAKDRITWFNPANSMFDIFLEGKEAKELNSPYGEFNLNSSSPTATVVIRPKTDKAAQTLEKGTPILFMEQESRIGFVVNVKAKVEKKALEVKAADSISKSYGTVLTPADVKCTVNGSNTTLEKLGVKNVADVLQEESQNYAASNANQGTYILKFKSETVETDQYLLTFNSQDSASLTISPVEPVLTQLSVTKVKEGDTLDCYALGGICEDPTSHEAVSGAFSWDTPDQKAVDGASYGFTFKPGSENYKEKKANAKIDEAANQISPEVNGSVATYLVLKEADETKTITKKYDGTNKGLDINKDIDTNFPLKSKIEITYSSKTETDGKIESKLIDKPVNAGTYEVNIHVPGTVDNNRFYTPIDLTATLIIEPAEAVLNFELASKTYPQGTESREVQILNVGSPTDSVYLAKSNGDKLTQKDYADYFEATLDESVTQVGTNQPVTIKVKEKAESEALIVRKNSNGLKVDNYSLAAAYTGKTDVTPVKVKAQANGQLYKSYGQEMNYVNSDFKITTQNGQPVYEDLQLTAVSEGDQPDAAVKSEAYKISVASGNPNYIVNSTEADLIVNPVTPELVSSVSASYGTNGDPASNIEESMHGAFVNPINGDPVEGNLALTSASRVKPLQGDTPLDFIFTPGSKNYSQYAGKFTAKGVSRPAPIHVISSDSVTYDGESHPVVLEEDDRVNYTIKYRKVGETLESQDAPVKVGNYEAIITASAVDGSSFSENIQIIPFVIAKATPQITLKPFDKVAPGTLLSSVIIEGTAEVNGQTIEGVFHWDYVVLASSEEDIKVVPGAYYKWVFEPDESENYNSVSGSEPLAEVADSETSETETPKGEDDKQEDKTEEGKTEEVKPGSQQGGNNNHSSGPSGGGGSSSAPSGGSSSTSGNENNEVIEEEPTAPQPDQEKPEESTSETTTTVETPDAKISYTRDETGLVSAYVEITPSAAAAGTAKVEMPAIKASTQSSGAITLEIPQDITEPVSVLIPVENANFGTMALAIDANGNETPYPYCYYDGNGSLVVPAGQSFTLVIKNMAKTFSDVPGDPNVYPANTIAFLSARGIMMGKGNGESFAPLENLTRGQLALMLYRLDGQKDLYDNTAVPAYVPENEYFARAAKWAVGSALMGQGGSSFNGYAPVTREQMALILYRYNGSTGADQSKLSGYTDSGLASSEEARDAISSLVAQGIMGRGTTSLKPSENATRQDVAAMIARWIQPALTTLK